MYSKVERKKVMKALLPTSDDSCFTLKVISLCYFCTQKTRCSFASIFYNFYRTVLISRLRRLYNLFSAKD